MKRPPGLWLLLTIVAVWLKVDDVYSLKATALIFGKTTTTTTSTAAPDVSESASEEGVTDVSTSESDGQNSTKPQLTGIPQIDYIWDPNLPRELNGYNLSEYPFYNRLPKDIDFKCDGLHDGFYASVPHKCQVYHHCLFGVRYDFLCANYTAFDQKTFICHFVSEVDCVNSKKFWHRNDALYEAASTTTVKPTPIYTLPPPPATSVPIVPILSRRPERPRRPPARRRPYDYYDEEYQDEDYYEKPVRRQRPRYRPRVYDEEYEYEEEDYARRPGGRRNENRRPYKSRGSNRRRPYDDEEYEDEGDSRKPDGGRRNNDDTRRPSKRRPMEDEEYDRRTYDRPRKKGYRRPIDDEYEDDLPPRRPSDRRKNNNREDGRKYDDEVQEERPRRNNRNNYDRNKNDDSVDEDVSSRDRDKNRNGESINDDKSNRNNEKNKNDDTYDDDRPLSKPPSSIYNRPRPAISKVRPPVPSREQARYSPKVPKATTPEPADEEYYDEYEEDIEKKEESRRSYKDNNRKIVTTTQSSAKRGYESKRKEEDEVTAEVGTSTRRYNKRPLYNDEGFGNKERRNNLYNRRRPIIPEYDDVEENSGETAKSTRKTPTTITTTATSTIAKESSRDSVVKVVKRPFLPSRGGNPYASRGLLPVGAKASESSDTEQNNTPELQNSKIQDEQLDNNKESPKQTPVIVKIPVRNKYVSSNDDEFRPISNRPVTRVVKVTTTTTTTTEKPRVIEKDPLDLDEYDVTLNDALNPTLPNLPIRNFPTGFSTQNDYTYNTVQRPRYVIDPTLNQASSDYVYRIEQPEQISNNIRYRSIPVYQNFRQSPKVTQAFYAPY